jgi:hypothetical protein
VDRPDLDDGDLDDVQGMEHVAEIRQSEIGQAAGGEVLGPTGLDQHGQLAGHEHGGGGRAGDDGEVVHRDSRLCARARCPHDS